MARKRSLPKHGDCYEAAVNYLLGKYLLQEPETRVELVHGEVTGQGRLEGITYGHAWIEEGDTVVDPSNGRMLILPRFIYYQIGRIDEVNNMHRYSWADAKLKLLEHKTYGPWDLKTRSGL